MTSAAIAFSRTLPSVLRGYLRIEIEQLVTQLTFSE
jgi:hypothetical protein